MVDSVNLRTIFMTKTLMEAVKKLEYNGLYNGQPQKRSGEG